MRTLATLAMAGLLACSATAFAGDTYKWKDDNGQWQYTQVPPANRSYEVIKDKRKNDQAEPAAPAAVSATTSAATPGNKADKGKAPTTAEDPAKKNCEVARENKRKLTEFTKIRITDKNGEVRLLSDDERAERMKQAEKDIGYFCADGK